MIEATTGRTPRTDLEASQSDKPDDGRCLCGASADGIDARDGAPTCADCARLETDGGPDDVEDVRRMLRRAKQLRREAAQLEIAAIGFSRGGPRR